MTDIQSKIQAAAPQNEQLLKILSETDHAKPTLEQHDRYINDIDNELKTLDKRIVKLGQNREKERKEHEKYRDSVMKRFAFKVSRKEGKFNERASKEEKDYFDVLQEEHQANEMRKTLAIQFDEAQKARIGLETEAARHAEAQRQLDDLYDSIFEGPTPGFADEDAKENAASHALTTYHNVRVKVEAEGQAYKSLTEAYNKMKIAQRALAEARSHSQIDMFGGGAAFDYMERSALAQASFAIVEAKYLVDQAQRISPEVKPFRPLQIPQGNLMSDVLFDNVFTDSAFHEKIKQAQREQEMAQRDLENSLQECSKRWHALKEQLVRESEGLENARKELQQIRSDAFREQAGGMPPAYSA